jgi:hypothetical protein
MPTALELAQRTISQQPYIPSSDISSRLFTSGSPRPPSPPQLKISPALTTNLTKPKLPEKPTLTGPPAPPKLVGPPKPPKQESKAHKKIMKKVDSFNQFLSGFKKGAVTLYEPLYTPIKQGLSKVGDVWKPDTEGYKDFLEGSKLLGKGALKVGKAVTIDTTPTVVRGLKRIAKDPGILSTKRISPYLLEGASTGIDYASKFITDPKTRGEASFYIADFLAPTGLLKGARLTDKAVRSGIIKLGAKEVPATKLFSPQVFKDGEMTTSLVRTTSPQQQFKDFFDTKGFFKEYPEHFVIQTSRQSKLPEVYKTLTGPEKKALDIKLRREDPSEWYSVFGHGNVWALRLPGMSKPSYKLSLFPSLSQTAKPEIGLTLVKRAERLPLDILKKDKGFDIIPTFQDILSTSRPSTTLFPKRSETSKIGEDWLRKLIRKVDPKTPGSSEEQFVKIQNVITQPASKLKPSNFIGRLKGYDEFVNVLGQPIPIRKEIISGVSIYKTGPRPKLPGINLTPLFSTEKGFINTTSKSLKNTIYDIADSIGEASYFRSLKRSKNTIDDFYRRELQGSITELTPSYSGISYFSTPSKSKAYTPQLTGSQPVYGGIKDTGSYPSSLKPTDYNIGKLFNNDYIPPEPKPDDSYPEPPKPDDSYPEPPKPDDDTYPVVYRQDGDYPTKPVYEPKDFVPKYPTKPSLSTYNFSLKGDSSYKPNRIFEYSRQEDYSSPKNLNQAFDVFVRTKGKWTKVKSKETMNYFYAKAKGFEIADKYAERSVKLKPTKKTAQLIGVSEPFNAYKFNWDKSKKETLRKSYIEKSKYAIDSIGEVRGISYKGLQARKNKKTKKKFSFL